LNINGSILLIPDNFNFLGSYDLSQFTVLSHKMLTKDNGTKIEVAFTLRRIINYHLVNTYLPTLGLFMIAIVTLQFDETKLELALGLTLTVMLVIYTMYQSISGTVTKTAYLKWLDYWLFFCLLMPFLIFMIEVHLLLKKEMMIDANERAVATYRKTTRRHHKFFRYVTYASTLIFILTYTIISVVFYLAE